MRPGAILPGHPQFDENHWRDDALDECYFDDKLWGWTCRVAEELRKREADYFNDNIIYNLLHMGTFDWTGENHRNDQSTQAMRHSTILGSRLYRLIHQGEVNVRSLVFFDDRLGLTSTPSA